MVEPSATVSATLMNVLYAGYDNPISISVPGVPSGQVQASIVNGNGTLQRVANGYVARPATIGKEAVIRVTATVDGRTQVMGDHSYRVRQLPDPSPFIEYKDANGNLKRYRGGSGLSKAVLMNTEGIVAAIDDGLLNINFQVLGFETTFLIIWVMRFRKFRPALISHPVRKICSGVYPVENGFISPGYVLKDRTV